MTGTGRNDPCPCGSGRKFKQCCARLEVAALSAGPSRFAAPAVAAPVRRASRDSDDPIELFKRGNALQAEGRLDEAVASYRRALERKPDYASAHGNLGVLLQRRGLLREAVDCYRRALSFAPHDPDLHYNLACALRDQGAFAEAVDGYRQAIAIRPGHVSAHVNLGNTLGAAGDLDGAVASYRAALSLVPDSVDAHYNLGVTRQLQGEPEAAIACYRRVIAIKPDHVLAQYNMGKAFAELAQWDTAVDWFRSSVAAAPHFAEARNSLGNTLQALGRPEEAIDCYRKAIESNPGDARAYNNLGNALNEMGQFDAALDCYRRALELHDTPEQRANFGLCLRHADLASASGDAGLRRLITRALAEAWTRPADLAAACLRAVRADRIIAACVERATAAWPARLSEPALYGPAGVAAPADNALLRHLVTSAPVSDVPLERFLTMARHVMLESAATAGASVDVGQNVLEWHCAIAQQCWFNEFAFATTETENGRAAQLRESLTHSLRSGGPIPALWVVAAAAYGRLGLLPAAETLLGRPWPRAVAALLDQHIREPLEEARLRAAMPRLTPIDDPVSGSVQRQYEANPYPRWTRSPGVVQASSVRSYLDRQFPRSSWRSSAGEGDAAILIAGCGTGQEAIETARQFPAARILAIDLSVSSLCYAQRKTLELGVTNIEYAQADILNLGSIGREFDVIASVGVLHHLADPAKGLDALLPLLRPGGFMRLGLYSEIARRDVVAAREYIAERGYGSAPTDIRRCRQELIDDPVRFGRLMSRRDFYGISECRDLLFHVEEHRFTLPQVEELLSGAGLQFVGFLLEPHVLHAYRAAFPDDASMTRLRSWSDFEHRFPDTFTGMYRFWVHKPEA